MMWNDVENPEGAWRSESRKAPRLFCQTRKAEQTNSGRARQNTSGQHCSSGRSSRGSVELLVVNHDRRAQHLPAKLPDPGLLFGMALRNQVETAALRVHAKGVLPASLLICRLHCGAVAEPDDLCRVPQVVLSLEATEVLRGQDEEPATPLLEVLRLLHEEARLD